MPVDMRSESKDSLLDSLSTLGYRGAGSDTDTVCSCIAWRERHVRHRTVAAVSGHGP